MNRFLIARSPKYTHQPVFSDVYHTPQNSPMYVTPSSFLRCMSHSPEFFDVCHTTQFSSMYVTQPRIFRCTSYTVFSNVCHRAQNSPMYSAMHKKRYKFYIEDFYAQKLFKNFFSMRNPKSWKKWSDWHQSQTLWSIWLDFIINWKLGVANKCKIFKWPLKLSLIISRFFELTLN